MKRLAGLGTAWIVAAIGVMGVTRSDVSAGAPAKPAETSVHVAESTLTLPTYEEDLPDVNPRFDLFARRPFLIYPYSARTNLTDRRSERTWREQRFAPSV